MDSALKVLIVSNEVYQVLDGANAIVFWDSEQFLSASAIPEWATLVCINKETRDLPKIMQRRTLLMQGTHVRCPLYDSVPALQLLLKEHFRVPDNIIEKAALKTRRNWDTQESVYLNAMKDSRFNNLPITFVPRNKTTKETTRMDNQFQESQNHEPTKEYNHLVMSRSDSYAGNGNKPVKMKDLVRDYLVKNNLMGVGRLSRADCRQMREILEKNDFSAKSLSATVSVVRSENGDKSSALPKIQATEKIRKQRVFKDVSKDKPLRAWMYEQATELIDDELPRKAKLRILFNNARRAGYKTTEGTIANYYDTRPKPGCRQKTQKQKVRKVSSKTKKEIELKKDATSPVTKKVPADVTLTTLARMVTSAEALSAVMNEALAEVKTELAKARTAATLLSDLLAEKD